MQTVLLAAGPRDQKNMFASTLDAGNGFLSSQTSNVPEANPNACTSHFPFSRTPPRHSRGHALGKLAYVPLSLPRSRTRDTPHVELQFPLSLHSRIHKNA